MQFLNRTLETPALNLALDEALLEWAEARQPSEPPWEVGRLWAPQQYAVILGRGSRYQDEVDLDFCRKHAIPILRRHSGGATVVIGPGSLLYSVVVSLEQRPELRDLNQAHRYVMQRVQAAVEPFCPEVDIQGICDLTLDDRKVSGNSLKVARRHFLYHGTLLYDFDLPLLASCLKTPPRQPDYRANRSHLDFVANLRVADGFDREFPAQFQRAWQTSADMSEWPTALAHQLATTKYECDDWTYRR